MIPGQAIPRWIHAHRFSYDPARLNPALASRLHRDLKRFRHPAPAVSIVMPVYNEAHTLLWTLSSLGQLELPFATELIIVNNGSTDRTQHLLDELELPVLFQPIRGIRYAREKGLEWAKGEILLQVDADSLYPPAWGRGLVQALEAPEIILAYGPHAILPHGARISPGEAIHHAAARRLYALRRRKREYLNVLGFNMAFRTEDARRYGSYAHTATGSDDGHMALTLMHYGQLALCTGPDNTVWTSNRRLMADGGRKWAFFRRFFKETGRLGEYLAGSPKI